MDGKPLRWLHGEVKTPPMSVEARREMGVLLRELQDGEQLSMPHSRPMPGIGRQCHELRVNDQNKTWRLVYRIDQEAIVILEVFEKKTNKTPQQVIEACRRRLKLYQAAKL
jgi:phage-related protein